MLNSEERELRKSQVGASEVYKLFNFDNQTLQSLFKQKIGVEDVPELDNEYFIVTGKQIGRAHV